MSPGGGVGPGHARDGGEILGLEVSPCGTGPYGLAFLHGLVKGARR